MARKPALPMTRKFALPKPTQARINEAAGRFAPFHPPPGAAPALRHRYLVLLIDILCAEIARSLNIQPDPPTPSPRTAFFLKRKFEQFSDSESEEEEEEEGGRAAET